MMSIMISMPFRRICRIQTNKKVTAVHSLYTTDDNFPDDSAHGFWILRHDKINLSDIATA